MMDERTAAPGKDEFDFKPAEEPMPQCSAGHSRKDAHVPIHCMSTLFAAWGGPEGGHA